MMTTKWIWSNTIRNMMLEYLTPSDLQKTINMIKDSRIELQKIFGNATESEKLSRITLPLSELELLRETMSQPLRKERLGTTEGLKRVEKILDFIRRIVDYVKSRAFQLGQISVWQNLTDSLSHLETKCKSMREEADRRWQQRQKKTLEKRKNQKTPQFSKSPSKKISEPELPKSPELPNGPRHEKISQKEESAVLNPKECQEDPEFLQKKRSKSLK